MTLLGEPDALDAGAEGMLSEDVLAIWNTEKVVPEQMGVVSGSLFDAICYLRF